MTSHVRSHPVRAIRGRAVTAALMLAIGAPTLAADAPGAKTVRGASAVPERARLVRLEELYATRWDEVLPGDVIVVADQRPALEALHIRRARGTPDRRIVIRAGASGTGVFLSSIVVEDSAHVVLEGLTVRGSRTPGVIIKKGSHDVTVTRCVVSENGLGVWITDGARCAHRIESNEVGGNATHGIAIDGVRCRAGEETVIARNRVHDNGQHGIEIHGNHYVVEENEVYRNGEKAPGTSGIHVFSRNERENTGQYNLIRYNVVYENRQPRGPDGNGIQLDQWCDHNQVSYNVVFSNDGAGIIVFDSADDRVSHNTVYGNMRDPDGKHPFKGEIVLATDADRRVDRVDNVVVENNIVVATRRGVASIVVDRPTSQKRLEIANNVFFNKSGGIVFSWAGVAGDDPVRWTSLKGRQRAPDLLANPMFESDEPTRMVDFRLKSGSIAIGKAPRTDQKRDAAGVPIPPSRSADLGALQWVPR